MARRPLPPPEVAIVDPISGLITRDWHDFFREQFALAIVPITLTPVPPLPAVTTSWSISTNAQTGNSFLVVVPDGLPVAIVAPTNPVNGQVVTYTIRNTSGGALGAVTWNAVFKLAAWTSPANGFSRSITFHYNGTNWIERSRTTVDVPN